MAYIKFKELSKYFDFKREIDEDDLPDYTKEYVSSKESIIGSYKNSTDYVVFTDKRMIVFDRDALGVAYKKIHMFPYTSISSSAINFKHGKVELLFSFDSGYQLHINFIEMNHLKKEKLKVIYKKMMNTKI